VANVAHGCTTPLVGDIDGDGKTEVLALNTLKSAINIFEGSTGASIGSINIGYVFESENPTCFLIVDGDKDGKAEVFIASTSTQKVYLYEVSSAPGVRPIVFSEVWTKSFPLTQAGNGLTPIVADFEGDGSVEFVAGRFVIDYATGDSVATLPYNSILSWSISISYAADVDGDGLPEIINGSDVYKYANGAISLYARCPTFPGGADGWNLSGDINMDGDIDVVFCYAYGKYTVWTPKTNTTIGAILLSGNHTSYPFIGDIDGDVAPNGKKYPEICFITSSPNNLYAYSYTGSGFTQKWALPHSDTSGATGVTLFDFNLDGVVELIYRDETVLRVFDGSGIKPDTLFMATCGSGTTTETPVVADVTGDGSADIIVIGGSNQVYVFEGGTSKWASAPNVWNQQMYSPLWVNTDLTIPETVPLQTLPLVDCYGKTVTYYNGGPMQAPYIDDASFCPVDLSPDVFVVGGSITTSSNTVTLVVTFGNQGLVTASASTPIRYYKNAIAPGNIIGSGSETLGASLAPGQTRTITKTITGLIPMPTQFYVRILDDGVHFPALGAYSDCNLTNNHKSFGSLELLKTVNSANACIDGTSIFNIRLINNTGQTGSPQTYNNIEITDSLGSGWEYLSSSVSDGSLSGYNFSTRKIQWYLSSLAPGDTAMLTITVKSVSAGSIRNSAWIESVDGTILGKEIIEAYVVVNTEQAPVAATISPVNAVICPPGSVTLTASVAGKSSYQWFLNSVEIPGATQQTHSATAPGKYTVAYFDPPCVSQMSDTATVNVMCLDVNSDNATVQEYQSVVIDILGNDDLPPGFFTPPFSLLDSVIPGPLPLAGTLAVIGSGANSKIIYTNNDGAAGLVNNIDSFQYQFTFLDPFELVYKTKRATVYIYVLQSTTGGFSTCYGENYTVRLAVKPFGVTFQWFDLTQTPIGTGSTRALTHVTADSVFWVQPVIPGASAPYNLSGGFPPGLLTVKVVNQPDTTALMRWTGLVNTNWYNPDNWVEMHTDNGYTYESPVSWAPTSCVDVVISSGAPCFPELTDSATCRNITVQDRALFKNPHILTYANARVEIKLRPSERDRFVMWSAPLKSMYSGDYHFKTGNTPQWGDVFMNLFQQANPSGAGVAQSNMFTSTFGQLGETLELGKAFNLRVTTTTVTKDRPWVFPQPDTVYTDRAGGKNSLIRTSGNRFITDGYNLTGGRFSMPVTGGNTVNGNLVQVVNPYLAYLNVAQFLSNNSQLASSGYLIWDGDVHNSFIALKFSGDLNYQPGMRYLYTGPAPSALTPEYIPPLQSFFVAKAGAGTSPVTSVSMSPDWTTTALPGAYVLRSTSVETGVLRIKAVQGDKTGYTVLQYDRNTSPAYVGNEDVQALFYDEIPLTLYSLTAQKEPLAISSSGDYSQNTDLGLRMMETGEIKLEFSGLSTFGHNVYLLDKEKGMEINLQQTPEYTFTATNPANVKSVEVNDRFTLRMEYTGQYNSEITTNPVLLLSGWDGRIHVRPVSGVISHLLIYNMAGMLIYDDHTVSDEFSIPVERSQTYIVKALTGNKYCTGKVIVK
jgi:uncharacterized repeat protein (TIGR01451 family)